MCNLVTEQQSALPTQSYSEEHRQKQYPGIEMEFVRDVASSSGWIFEIIS
jgi:hypothetical protein